MIAKESILRHLPSTMDRKQALFLDGIRHAAEIAGLAYKRLQFNLTRIAMEDPEGEESSMLYTSAFLDAWSLVDVIDRFRALWQLLPGTSADKHEKEKFIKLTGSHSRIFAANRLASDIRPDCDRKRRTHSWCNPFQLPIAVRRLDSTRHA